MSGNILRDTIIVGIMAVGVATAAANREAIYEKFELAPVSANFVKPKINPIHRPAPKTQQVKSVKQVSGMAVSIPKSKADGQFWTDARVNSGHVRFLVDTGASSVALTPEDARKAGVRLSTLVYDIPISTAGGDNVAALVHLKSISIGAVTVRNVRAIVVPEGLSTSLLGMTFLGELQKVEASPEALILRL